uniref:Uncharacterized protein n=1 Tax=Haptolina brevifila TaxID=156173 RepID=A0A6U7N6F0_9EUKA
MDIDMRMHVQTTCAYLDIDELHLLLVADQVVWDRAVDARATRACKRAQALRQREGAVEAKPRSKCLQRGGEVEAACDEAQQRAAQLPGRTVKAEYAAHLSASQIARQLSVGLIYHFISCFI